MAVKINAGDDVKRGEFFFVSPGEIQVDHSLNGRWTEHAEDDVTDLAESFHREGQLQPCLVRKVAGNKLQLVAGYRRHAAVVKHNELYPDSPLQLKVIVTTVNDQEAFFRNVEENRARKSTSPVDDAVNQRKLRDAMGWKDKDIAALYKMSQGYVSQLKKILTLSRKTQEKIHAGKLTVAVALDLASLPTDRADAIVEEATAEVAAEEAAKPPEPVKKKAGRPKKTEEVAEEPIPVTDEPEPKKGKKDKRGGSITGKVRAKLQTEAQTTGGKAPSKTLAEVKDFFQSLTGPAEDRNLVAFAENVLAFIAGEVGEREMEDTIKAALGVVIEGTRDIRE